MLDQPTGRLHDDLDQPGTSIFHRAFKLGGECFNRRGAARFDAHAGSQFDPIKFGMVQIEHRNSLGAGNAGAGC